MNEKSKIQAAKIKFLSRTVAKPRREKIINTYITGDLKMEEIQN
jgi:hypothetical protein